MRNNRFSLRSILSIISAFIIITATGCANKNEIAKDNSNQSSIVASDTIKQNDKTSESKSSMVVAAPVSNTIKATVTAKGSLKVHFIDVGQADSILIQQNGKNMLIDAGNNQDSTLVVNYLKKQGVSKLDYVIGTHPHEDHIGGLDVVIKTFSIGQVYMPKVTSTTATFKDVVSAISSKGLKITTPTVGTTFKLGEAVCTIIAPNSSTYKELNDYSIAIKLKYGNNSFVFMGDAENISEGEILAKQLDIKADVLKIGHHGSSSSTTDKFLFKVNPKYAVISLGKGNDYGHPHKLVMDRLKAKGISVYRTDEAGTIVATSDGTKITFSAKPGSYVYGSAGNSSSESKSSSSSSTNKTTAVVPVPKTITPKSSNSSIKTVYYTPKGKSYHFNNGCRTLAKSKTILSGSLSEAINSGHADPCDVCVAQ